MGKSKKSWRGCIFDFEIAASAKCRRASAGSTEGFAVEIRVKVIYYKSFIRRNR
jgi:hypothetical protein